MCVKPRARRDDASINHHPECVVWPTMCLAHTEKRGGEEEKKQTHTRTDSACSGVGYVPVCAVIMSLPLKLKNVPRTLRHTRTHRHWDKRKNLIITCVADFSLCV